MREIVYYSKTAPTKGSFSQDLQKAGRMDIAVHSVIAAFFLSHDIRRDMTLHMIFDGAPDPTKHLEFKPVTEGKTGEDKIYLNKKDIASIIRKMLYKYKPGAKNEVFPGYSIEKKSLIAVLKELKGQNKQIYVLDPKGESLRKIKIEKSPVFLIGDHQGLPALKKELKRLDVIPASVGKRTYFASQTITIVNNELDLREDSI